MLKDIVSKKKDFRHLQWSHGRRSSGTAGTFLKSQTTSGNRKIYYKLSNFDVTKGVIGHECVNEIVVGRLLDILGVEHLKYQLIHAEIEIEGKEIETWLCKSEDFKEPGESKTAFDNYFSVNAEYGLSPYDFAVRNGWGKYIDTMIAVDFLILNRDRHGANIEILRNSRKKTVRIAPLFDHGLSLLCSCMNDSQINGFDVMKDRLCNNFIGGRSCLENLELIQNKRGLFQRMLLKADKQYITDGLELVLPEMQIEKIWEMIFERWKYFEKFCNFR